MRDSYQKSPALLSPPLLPRGLGRFLRPLLGFLIQGGRRLVPHGFHVGSLQLAFLVDGLAVQIHRLALHRRLSVDGVPLLSFGVLINFVVSPWGGVQVVSKKWVPEPSV